MIARLGLSTRGVPESCLGAVVGSDVEALRWDSWDPYGFYVSMENGLILNFNARTLPYDLGNPSPSWFTLSTHDGTASALDINPHARGALVTGGTEGRESLEYHRSGRRLEGGHPGDQQRSRKSHSTLSVCDTDVLCETQGKVFSTVWSPDGNLTLAGKFRVWDTGANHNVREALGAELTEAGKTFNEKGGRMCYRCR